MKNIFYFCPKLTKMNMKIISGCFLLASMLFAPFLSAQELNCRVTVNSDKIQGTNKQRFIEMQKTVTEFMNNRRWSEYNLTNSERIECSFYITINEMPQENQFKGELQIQAVRPVYNTSYLSTTFNFRDPALEFYFNDYDVLEYNQASLSNNLTAVLAFYAYIVLGIDFDSFSLYGGTPFFDAAMNLVNLAQSFVEPGWRSFDSNNNRHAVASAYTDERLKVYRQMWYTYHRLGLDDMGVNVERGRAKITAALPALKESYDARPTSVVFPLFSGAKIDEVINIYSKATSDEKETVYKILQGIYPTLSNRLDALKR